MAEQVPDPALKGWSEKEGQLYVQAPLVLLQQLLAVRLHVDDCGDDDGPLQVLAGSHLDGLMGVEAAFAARQTQTPVSCLARQGDAMLMRPLLVHSSSRSTGSSKRRVLHFFWSRRVAAWLALAVSATGSRHGLILLRPDCFSSADS